MYDVFLNHNPEIDTEASVGEPTRAWPHFYLIHLDKRIRILQAGVAALGQIVSNKNNPIFQSYLSILKQN